MSLLFPSDPLRHCCLATRPSATPYERCVNRREGFTTVAKLYQSNVPLSASELARSDDPLPMGNYYHAANHSPLRQVLIK